jgi:hypothetical protein
MSQMASTSIIKGGGRRWLATGSEPRGIPTSAPPPSIWDRTMGGAQ